MRSLTLNCDKKQIFSALKNIANDHSLIILHEDDKTICLQKSSSLFSFGNSVECKVYKKNQRYIVYVRSESDTPIQIIDWGINGNIEDLLINELRSNLGSI